MSDSFCSSCGTKNKQGSNFCTNCGTKIHLKATIKKEKHKKTIKKSNSFFILFVALLISVSAIAVVYESNRKSYQKKLSSKVSQSPLENPDLNGMMKSVQELRKALNEDPENYDLNVKMANNFFDIGRFPEAIEHYQKAIKVNDSDPDVLIDLGVALFNTNDSESALNYMDAALKINPKHPQGLYNSGIVQFNMGDSTGAVKMWEKLIETNSHSPQAQTAKKFIEQLKRKIIKS